MRLIQRFKLLPLRLVAPRLASKPHAVITTWRLERSGTYGGYAVYGWRYTDLAIWHVKLWSIRDDGKAERSYIVSAGEFYPESAGPAEKFAALRLIAGWEADRFN